MQTKRRPGSLPGAVFFYTYSASTSSGNGLGAAGVSEWRRRPLEPLWRLDLDVVVTGNAGPRRAQMPDDDVLVQGQQIVLGMRIAGSVSTRVISWPPPKVPIVRVRTRTHGTLDPSLIPSLIPKSLS